MLADGSVSMKEGTGARGLLVKTGVEVLAASYTPDNWRFMV